METISQTSLFGPNLYGPDEKTARGLESDINRIDQIRRTWVPSVGPKLLSDTSVGTYDKSRAKVTFLESSTWAQELKDFPDIPLAEDAPMRHGFAPRGTCLLRAMRQSFPSIPDTPFWHSAAEQTYSYTWTIQDNTTSCAECLKGTSSMSVFATFIDYYHFLEHFITILDVASQRVVEYIEHVHRDHEANGPEYKLMDAWLMTCHSLYLDILHPKSDAKMKFPVDELNSIRYRLVNAGVRALALQARLEHGPLVDDDDLIDAFSFATLIMHDACDRRHDNKAHEFYNAFTMISGHTGVESVDIIRRFTIDVWAWAIDNRADWAIHLAGRMLLWQYYMARYNTSTLLDNLNAPEPGTRPSVDVYGDSALNFLNPLTPSEDPLNFNLRDRCQDKARFDELYESCQAHFRECSNCRDYPTATYQERVPIVGKAYETKYDDMKCTNVLAAFLILDHKALEPLWWAADPNARYTGPTGEWSGMLC